MEGTSMAQQMESEHRKVTGKLRSYRSIYNRLTADRNLRINFINSLIILAACISLGWADTQVGSSLLDLQIITGTTLERLSAIFTANYIGYITGSLFTGFLFGRVHTNMILFVSCVVSATTSVAIPWCSILEVMIFVFLMRGIANGMQNTSSNAMLLRAWGKHHKYYLQALHFCYGFGGIISPLITAPFLLAEIPSNSSMTNSRINTTLENPLGWSSDLNTASIVNKSNESMGVATAEESRLYLAYLMTGILYFIAAVLFISSFIASRKEHFPSNRPTDTYETPLTLKWKIISLTNMLILMLMQVSIEIIARTFLATFCVKRLSWTKKEGAFATSVLAASFSTGRFIDIFSVKLFKPSNLLIIYSVLLTISLTGFLFSSIYIFDIGIWICVAATGFAMSVTFPSILTWTEDEFVPVTGKIASLFIVSAAAACMISPVVLGSLIENVTIMFVCYVPLGECAIVILCYILGVIISKKIQTLRKRKTTLMA